MKPDDKDKLNQCIEILESTDLGLSLVWLWVWDTAKSILRSDEWQVNVTEDQLWDYLCEAVEAGHGFSLEYGADQLYDDILEWMLNREYIIDPTDIDEDEDEDEEDVEDGN